ncbi:MAG: acyltransferase [Verrucomicrobiaceae bacterium]|nr:acyltransferase [Verrucomicrobiaceae bacterium]
MTTATTASPQPGIAKDATVTAHSGHSAAIDSLRGLAALMVVVFHMEFWGFPIVPGHVAMLGALGVNLFFTLSGFLIGRAVLLPSRFDRLKYLKNRSLRILPNYFICCFLVLFIVNGNAIGHATPGELAFDLGTHALLMHAWFGSTANTLIGPLWTLSHEWIFYLIIFAAAPCLRSRRGWIVPFFMCVAALAGKYLITTNAWAPSTSRMNPVCMWDQFGLGIIGALCSVGSAAWKRRPLWLWVVLGLGVLLMGACFYRQHALAAALHASEAPEMLARRTKGMGQNYAVEFYRKRSNVVWFPFVFSTGVSLVLVAVSSGFQGLNRWLEKTPLPWLGMVSYSTYLYHMAVLLCLVRGFSGAAKGGIFASRGAACVVAVAGIYAISAFCYHLFEKPWLDRKAKSST